MWENVVEPDRPQTIIWRMRVACWIPKATYTKSEYVTFIAFPLVARTFLNCTLIQTLPVSFKKCSRFLRHNVRPECSSNNVMGRRTSKFASLLLIFWRRNYFFNFSTPCI